MNVPASKNTEYVDEVLERFFVCPAKDGALPEARAVMVDMEPKVYRCCFCCIIHLNDQLKISIMPCLL